MRTKIEIHMITLINTHVEWTRSQIILFVSCPKTSEAIRWIAPLHSIHKCLTMVCLNSNLVPSVWCWFYRNCSHTQSKNIFSHIGATKWFFFRWIFAFIWMECVSGFCVCKSHHDRLIHINLSSHQCDFWAWIKILNDIEWKKEKKEIDWNEYNGWVC